MYKTSVLRIDYLWMYVISSPWVIKLWEFSFPKLKIKTAPFSWFREFAFPIEKKSPFLAKWVRAWMYALVRTGGTAGTGTGSPIGGSPTKFEPNPSSLYRNAWELLDQWWDSNGGSSAERGLKLIKPLAPPTKVDFNSISRFCANAQTWWGTKSLYLSREQKIRYLQVTTCR